MVCTHEYCKNQNNVSSMLKRDLNCYKILKNLYLHIMYQDCDISSYLWK